MAMGIRIEDAANDILYISFNQDASCISIGTREGYRIYNTEPFEKSFHITEGGIGFCEMLYCTSLIALVGGGEQPAFSPRRLRIWNTKTKAAICDLNFVTTILNIQMNRQRIVVVLEQKIYIFDLNSMQILETLVTPPNPSGLCVLSPSSENGYMAFPTGVTPGEVLMYDAINLTVMQAIPAHQAVLVSMAFNSTGSLLATASETGTLLRVFKIPGGKKYATFRRGSYSAAIYSLAFNESSTLLCASSATGTIHIFSLLMTSTSTSTCTTSEQLRTSSNTLTHSIPWMSKINSAWVSTSSSATTSTSTSTSATTSTSPSTSRLSLSCTEDATRLSSSSLPTSSSSSWASLLEGTRDFAYARLRNPGIANICSIHGPKDGAHVAFINVATVDGYFYQYQLDVMQGGLCRLEKEHVLRDSESEAMGAKYLG